MLHKLHKYSLFFLLGSSILIILVTCTYTWHAIPTGVPEVEMCDPHKDSPQMLQIPMFEKTWQTVESCDLFPREKVGISLIIFYNNWRLKFGDHDSKVWHALNHLMLEWSGEEKRITVYSMDGNLSPSARISGLARTPTMIWMHAQEGDRICQSSLVHELVHISIWALKGVDCDPDHLGGKYSGWTPVHNDLIRETNTVLCTLGL